MIKDESFGIIPLQIINRVWHVLLIKQRYGRHWSFPKGHSEGDETPEEAANREFFEETGLTLASYLSPIPLTESYEFRVRGNLISKTVHYFVALVKGEICLDLNEIVACKWVPLSQAHDHVTFPQAKSLCAQVLLLIKSNLHEEDRKPL